MLVVFVDECGYEKNWKNPKHIQQQPVHVAAAVAIGSSEVEHVYTSIRDAISSLNLPHTNAAALGKGEEIKAASVDRGEGFWGKNETLREKRCVTGRGRSTWPILRISLTFWCVSIKLVTRIGIPLLTIRRTWRFDFCLSGYKGLQTNVTRRRWCLLMPTSEKKRNNGTCFLGFNCEGHQALASAGFMGLYTSGSSKCPIYWRSILATANTRSDYR